METGAATSTPAQNPVRKLAGNCSLDRVGMWVSGACAVHCAALPLLLTVAGLGFLGDERFEWTIIGFSFVVASLRLFHSYFQEHRRADAIFLFLMGASAILLAKSGISSWESAEVLGMTTGGTMIAMAHWRNHRLSHACGSHRH